MARRGGGRDQNEITKNIKQGPVEVDYEESSLVVHYEIEMIEVDERGATIAILDRKPEMRRIKIKSLSPDRNMAQLAADIIDKCKYIHPSRTEEIEQLLIKLRKYHIANGHNLRDLSNSNNPEKAVVRDPHGQGVTNYANYQNQDMNVPMGDDSYQRRSESRGRNAGTNRQSRNDDRYDQRGGNDRDRDSSADHNYNNHANDREGSRRNGNNHNTQSDIDRLPPADMNELDDYLELLYEVSGKTDREREEVLRKQEHGTAMILKLCRDVMNLEQLIQNSTVMGAITRVLQEEFKKSLELTYNILRIFLAFSNFTEMHSLMANYKIGVLTMKAVDYEIKRMELRETERQEREYELQQELQRAKDDSTSGTANLDQDDTNGKSSNSSSKYAKLLEKQKKQREKENVKNKQFYHKQQKVFFIAFYILINLAEDTIVERKMMKKGLLQQLFAVLLSKNHDTSAELMELILRFLKKLSIYEENKDIMKEMKIIPLLMKFLTCNHDTIIKITLRLLFNLSFDKDCREQMLKNGYIPKLSQLLKIPKHRAKVLKLLYHLSVDDRCKSMITYTDAMPLLMGFVINIPEERLPGELAALMINLSYYPKNCELMIQNRGLNLLMDRFNDKRDPLLMKIIRNISLWSFNQQQDLESPEVNYKYRALWTPHIKLLIDIMLESDNQDLIIEIVGCLANMTVYDLPSTSNWSKLLREYNLMNYFTRLLVPGMTQNDLLLEIIMLIATIATDQAACSILATGNLITTLYQIFKEKTEDSEVTLQLLNCFHKLLYAQSSREVVMYSTRIFSDIIECLGHRNSSIRAKAEKMSEFVYEYDRKADGELGQMAKSIIKKRFENYNRLWLNTVFGSAGGGPGSSSSGIGGNGGVNMSNNSLYGSYSGDISVNTVASNARGGGGGGPGQSDYGPSSYDRLPTSQEMLHSAKYLNDKMDTSLDWQFDGSNKAVAPSYNMYGNVQDISKLDDDYDELDERGGGTPHDDLYDYSHMQNTQSEIDSWNRPGGGSGRGNSGYGGGNGYYK